jgi:hypothetical protein
VAFLSFSKQGHAYFLVNTFQLHIPE